MNKEKALKNQGLEFREDIASEGVSIFAYDSRSKGAKSYAELAEEVLNHA